LGAVMVAFAKEKHEDEFIAKIRLESFLWATYINYAILLFSFLFFYGIGFMYVMIFNMFTIIILFIVRFNYILYRSTKQLQYEKQS
jgi:Ca2+-dependent lipid-binding protein